jgi:hypothetical protein
MAKSKRVVYDDVELFEVSAVGIPSYRMATRSFIKSLKLEQKTDEVKIMAEAPSEVEKKVETDSISGELKKQKEQLDELLKMMKEMVDCMKVKNTGLTEPSEKEEKVTKQEEPITEVKYERGKDREFFQKLSDQILKSGWLDTKR